MTKLAISGAAGRMGTRLVALASADAQLKVVAAVERAASPALGRDAGELAGVGAIGVLISEKIETDFDALIDFSAPAATRQFLEVCKAESSAMLIGTTGLSEQDLSIIQIASASIPLIQAANTSLGVNLLLKVAAQIAAALGDDYDKEIVEGHHRFKKDAPSGTALALADAVLKGMGKTRDSLVYDRHGDDVVRKPGDIGMHALRIGDEVGRHTLYFSALGERIELTHVATNRDTFARGALRAAKWIAGKKPGRYTMGEVLGL